MGINLTYLLWFLGIVIGLTGYHKLACWLNKDGPSWDYGYGYGIPILTLVSYIFIHGGFLIALGFGDKPLKDATLNQHLEAIGYEITVASAIGTTYWLNTRPKKVKEKPKVLFENDPEYTKAIREVERV